LKKYIRKIEMDIGNRTIEDWLEDAKGKEYPFGKKKDYSTPYKTIKSYLDNIHKQVTTGANLENQKELLNNHGPEHIEKVIEKTTELVDCKSCDLTPYEIYILLSSIQLHDVGNLYGRENHEANLQKIIEDSKEIFTGKTL